MATYLGLSLDATTHDLHLTDEGHLATVTDAAAVGQLGKQRLMTYLGEWFLDTATGVPWFQRIFVRPFDDVIAESLIKRSILRTRGVTELLSFEMHAYGSDIPDRDERRPHRRRLNIARCDVRTEFDEVVNINV